MPKTDECMRPLPCAYLRSSFWTSSIWPTRKNASSTRKSSIYLSRHTIRLPETSGSTACKLEQSLAAAHLALPQAADTLAYQARSPYVEQNQFSQR